MTEITSHLVSRRTTQPLMVGADWIIRGLMESEAGVDVVLASRSEPVPGFDQAVERFQSEIADSAIAVETTESDVISAGLLRSGLLAGRRTAALFGVRGFRQAVDSLYEAARLAPNTRGGGIIVVCHARWMATQADRRSGVDDPRALGKYLNIPILEPADPIEGQRLLNEAMRLSRAGRTLVMVYLSPSLMGGGETISQTADPTLRPVPATLNPEMNRGISAVHEEARRRHLDRVLNAPVAGEQLPLGFITAGTAHASLRHAINMLGLSGRFPILKLGLIHPLDPRSVESFLTRCRTIVVFENGQRVIEEGVMALTHRLEQRGEGSAAVFGRTLPNAPERRVPIFGQQAGELHPSALARTLGPLLLPYCSATDQKIVKDQLASMEAMAPETKPIHLGSRTPPRDRETDLLGIVVDLALRDIGNELSRRTANRPPIDLDVESMETTSLETAANRRTIIVLERRRLAASGRAAINHAIRRRLNLTFLVVPDGARRRGQITTTEADRLVRSMIADAEALRAVVSILNPTEGPAFRTALKNEILSDGVSVVILDPASPTYTQPVGGDREEWNRLGYAPRESLLRPASPSASLGFEWLIRHGWNDPIWLDGINGPRIDLPDPNNPSETPLDAWDGFEEFVLQRHQAPPPLINLERATALAEPTPDHSNRPYWRAHLCGPPGTAFDNMVRVLDLAAQRMDYRVQLMRGQTQSGAFAQIVFSRPRADEPPKPVTARIPFGEADLILALDMPSLLGAIDPANGHLVASAAQTALILDHSEPLWSFLNPNELNRRPVVPGELNEFLPPARRTVLRAGDLCDRVLNSRRMVGVMLLGVAFQRGLIPLGTDPLTRAARSLSDDPLDQGSLALQIGRLVVETGGGLPGATTLKSRSPESMIRRHATILAASPWPGASTRAEQFTKLAHGTLDAITGLRRRDPLRRAEQRFIARLMDTERWGGHSTARAYADRVRAVYAAERSVTDYPITRLAIDELSRAILIADPIFLASTSLRADRLRQFERRFNVNRHQGDSLTFRIRGRSRLAWLNPILNGYWSLGPAACRILRRLRPLRYWPWWYRTDRVWRDWVIELVDQAADDLPHRASLWLEVFRQLTRVRGCGRRRVALMRGARRAVMSLFELGAIEGANTDSKTQKDTSSDFSASNIPGLAPNTPPGVDPPT